MLIGGQPLKEPIVQHGKYIIRFAIVLSSININGFVLTLFTFNSLISEM